MEALFQQRYAIKLCVRLQKSASETFDMICEAINDKAMSRASIFHWHKACKERRQNVEDIEITETTINTQLRLSTRRIEELQCVHCMLS
ncbi:hypothetical protein TNCT_157581 [Trichonephila clavata]|uniref:Mos1 transposase HTH domain-containing protein n=1 Tax=Trichonephila clavata TaxID=2740835 RepID=A0A8X6FW85_TRICU|nr:hypothetical protein TNCT_157581 [Trichonephila clavata]